MLTDNETVELEALLMEREVEYARKNLLEFTSFTFKKFNPKWYHKVCYNILDRFAKKEIKNLILSIPPQHGKSEASSRRLPAFVAGTRTDDKMALVSYSASKAQKFGREIMGIMREPEYKALFPQTIYPERGHSEAKANTNMERESLHTEGSMRFVGVGGPLTGETVDILIYDDLYKDWQDANSPIYQEKVWDWYTTVATTRLHNESQQLMVFTRWNENDLIGKLNAIGAVVFYDGTQDLDYTIDNLTEGQFLSINFAALKEGHSTPFDPRAKGEALWEEKHSKQKLENARAKDPDKFDCLYQGNPINKQGVLYSKPFKTYSTIPILKMIKAYVDTADTGKDFLCAVVYGIPLAGDNNKYVLDVLYTDEGMEVTETQTALLFNKNRVNVAKIESNNGGRSFARNVRAKVSATEVDWFHQSRNKEARIYSNSATVNNEIVFPDNWHILWPSFYKAVTKFKKVFRANSTDDAPDSLTGIIETETENIKVITPTVDNTDLGLF